MKGKKGSETLWHVIVFGILALLLLFIGLMLLGLISGRITLGIDFLEGLI